MSSKELASINDLFEEDKDEEKTSAEASATAFGSGSLGKIQRDKLTKIDIDIIYPDLQQPRRVIPTRLALNQDTRLSSVEKVFEEWCGVTNIDPTKQFDVPDDKLDLLGEEHKQNPLAQNLMDIITLAIGIHRHGLTNAITVVRNGDNYIIETGERRWYAFHLLRLLFPQEEQYEKIPARIMPQTNVWRQAVENNVRSGLNAIAKARQYAILLMDMLPEASFKPLVEFEDSQAFYAQVQELRIPRGQGGNVMQAMGFDSRESVRRHRDLLGLPKDIWNEADDFNTPESVLRQIVDKPQKEGRMLFDVWLIKMGIVTSGDNSKKPNKEPAIDSYLRRSESQRKSILRDVKKGKNIAQWKGFIKREIEKYSELLKDIENK